MSADNEHPSALNESPAIYPSEVLSKRLLGASVYEITLSCPEVDFLPGQYLEVMLDQTTAVPYSIASAPTQSTLTLHIQNQGEDSLSEAVLERLQNGAQVELRMPMGECALRCDQVEADEVLLFVAAGTGFAQMKSMIEAAIAAELGNPMVLYWGARTPDQLYALELAERWAEEVEQLRVVPVVSELVVGWLGRSGLVHRAALEDFEDLSAATAYVCGSPQMVYAVEDDFLQQGLRSDRIYSDVFAYAPRPN